MEFQVGDEVKRQNSENSYTKYENTNTADYLLEIFDKYFTKIEDELVKQKPEPKFKVGAKVKILDNRSEFKGRVGYVKSYHYKRLLGMSNYNCVYMIDSEADKFSPITDIPEMALGLVIEKIEKPELLPVGTRVRVTFPGFFFGEQGYIVESSDKMLYRVRFDWGQEGVFGHYSIKKIQDPKLKDKGGIDMAGSVERVDHLDIWCGCPPVEKAEEPKQEELKVGDSVEVLSDAAGLMIATDGIQSAIGKIGKIESILTDGIFRVTGLPPECYREGRLYFAYWAQQLKKVDKPKDIWEPRFKVGDWVSWERSLIKISSIDYENKLYCVEDMDGELWEVHIEFWQPMQKLKEIINSQMKEIKESHELLFANGAEMEKLYKMNDTQSRSIKNLMGEVKDLKSRSPIRTG